MENDTTPYRLAKASTGIAGMDEITTGGLPLHRATLLVGSTGCGKTVLAMEFIVNGITKFDETAVYLSFEEPADEIIENVKSFGYNLKKYIDENKLYIEHIQILENANEKSEMPTVEGLFARIAEAIDKVKAKRVVLDSLDSLFYGFNYFVLRSVFRRVVMLLKEKGVTAIITGETGDRFLSRHGLEEYVADCVIILECHVAEQTMTRFMRIIKYRGSTHGNSEYPFVIDNDGVTVFPVVSEPLAQEISTEIISTGIADLDQLLSKKGVFVGSSTLISGTAGTGKTSIAASFVVKACEVPTSCIYCAFEESPEQITRNMESIGITLHPLVEAGRLYFYASRPTVQNIELHFINIKKIISERKPSLVVLDPITNLMSTGSNSGIRLLLTRFVDYLKAHQITVVFTAAITEKLIERNPSDEGISSMVDTWIMVDDAESDSERRRTCTIMKSRGMGHSQMVKEFVLNSQGIFLHEITHEYH